MNPKYKHHEKVSESKKQVDINIIIRLDDQLKEKLPSANVTVDESGKITTPLSVAQLAYTLRVLIETGTLETDNLSNLFRFASEHISTTRQEEISFDSIRNKFYKPATATKEAVLDLFVKQVSYIRKDVG